MEKVILQPKQPASEVLQQPSFFYRITALWALSEAFLGGVLHALHLPGTGLFVGGVAVLCISLLAYHCPGRHAILKATILVILVKGILSPHTPPGAYLAVFIQGGLGYLLFLSKRYYKLSCLVLGVLTQLQSAIQRLVIMLIMFGTDLYKVADSFINYILKKAGFPGADYVLYVVLLYIGLHILMGVLVGSLAGKLPGILQKNRQNYTFQTKANPVPEFTLYNNSKKKSAWARISPLLLIIITILITAGLYYNLIENNTAYTILLRAVLVAIFWGGVLSPILQRGVQHWSAKKQSILASDLNQVLQLMPFMYSQAQHCWVSTLPSSLLKRLLHFPVRFIFSVLT